MKESNQKLWYFYSGISFFISVIMVYLGYDKLTNYHYSDAYSSLNKNAYVGGDAYNYIINSSRSTSFFVLATMFAIIGISFIVIGYLDKAKFEFFNNSKYAKINTLLVEHIKQNDDHDKFKGELDLKLYDLRNFTIDSVQVVNAVGYNDNRKEAYIIYH